MKVKWQVQFEGKENYESQVTSHLSENAQQAVEMGEGSPGKKLTFVM